MQKLVSTLILIVVSKPTITQIKGPTLLLLLWFSIHCIAFLATSCITHILKNQPSIHMFTLNVDKPYSLVVCTVSGETLVIFVMKSSRYLHACSRWVVLMMICTNYRKNATIWRKSFLFRWRYVLNVCVWPVCMWVWVSGSPTSVSPMWGFLMRFCRQLLRVLVRSRLVDFRNISSISVELGSHDLWLITPDISQLHNKYRGLIMFFLSTCWVRLTCGGVTLRIWGWRKWTLWPVCRSEGLTGTLAAFLEIPAAHTDIQKQRKAQH